MATPFTRATQASALSINNVLRNTYMLLSMTLVFSAACAGLSMYLNVPPMGLGTMLLYFGLLWFCSANRNNMLGIVGVFALTGVLGFTLGPILNAYIYGLSNGSTLVMTALGGTGVIFLGLSGYVLTSGKDFSYLGGFMMAGMMVLLMFILANIFLQLPMIQLAISAGFVLFSSGMILFETSQIINGGERNYIMATISLYVSLYNLFISLLQLLSAFNNRN